MKYSEDSESMEQHIGEDPRFAKYYTALTQSRTIFLCEDVTKNIASTLSAMLLYYDNQNHDDIVIYINSRGGDATALSNIYDVMGLIKSPINTFCIGKAYSAAAFILCAGAKGKRVMTKNANVMIHGMQCVFPMSPISDQKDSEIYYNFLKNYNDMILNILAKHTKKSLERIKKDCARDLYLDAKQALTYGIIDYII